MTIGRDTFWTPAHLMIQAGGLIAGLPAALVNLKLHCINPQTDDTFAARLQEANPHPVNVFHLDAPVSRDILMSLPLARAEGLVEVTRNHVYPAFRAAGLKVPHGCHMRRMNPRDSKLAILTDVNLHRLSRRSTTFGPPYDPDLLEDDGAERGLFFIGLSAKAAETMEFMQQEWINHGNFIDLGEERDPLVGQQPDGATFTLPERPVRRRIHGIQSFCTLRGGEYLFMPGLRALRRLGGLDG